MHGTRRGQAPLAVHRSLNVINRDRVQAGIKPIIQPSQGKVQALIIARASGRNLKPTLSNVRSVLHHLRPVSDSRHGTRPVIFNDTVQIGGLMANSRNSQSRIYHAPPGFAWAAAAIATAFAGVGALIVAGAGATPVGQIMAVLVGFLLLGAGSVLALAMALPDEVWRVKSNEDWTYW